MHCLHKQRWPGIFEEETASSSLECRMDILVGVECGDYDDSKWILDAGTSKLTSSGKAVKVRHADIEQADIGSMTVRHLDGLVSIARLGHDFHVGLTIQDGGESGPHDLLIVGDQDPNGHRSHRNFSARVFDDQSVRGSTA